jgi:hypothetical protein
LFEPLEVDESAGDGDEVAPRELEQPDDENRWSRRLVFTGVLLATMAAAAAMAIVLLQPARPAKEIVTPTDSTPLSTATSTLVPSTTAAPVPVLPATVSTSAIRTSAAIPTVQPQQPPVQLPTTIASESPAPMPPPPTTRAPISVSPESRAPFPNQEPPGNSDQRGGLLGRLV